MDYTVFSRMPFNLSGKQTEKIKEIYNFIKKNYNIIKKISGMILIILGIYMIFF